MGDPNVYAADWEFDRTESAGMRATRVGAAAGSRDLGASVYELSPGGAVSPYHAHHANEELLVVLNGRPRVRTPEGTRDLEPGAVVSFLPGTHGAHRVFNPSDEPVRVLIVSTMRLPEIAEYPEIGATLARTAPGEGRAFAAGADQPFPELYEAAMAADRARDDSPT